VKPVPLENPYCTIEDLREHLKDSHERLDETLLERAINAACRAIERYCGRKFWLDPAPTVHHYRPVEPDLVAVHDIGSASDLVVQTLTGGGWETWDPSDYTLEPLNADAAGGAYSWTRIAAAGGRSFPVGVQAPALRITAYHGWSQVPDDIVQAAVLKAAALFRRKDAPFGIAGVGDFGPVRITRRDVDVVELLGNFLRPFPPDT